ncbi:hypothetical protein DL95DRAFT_270487, partial [Leptodontidium sp. 2 PMI_412]
LTSQTVLVTGATSGVGKEAARNLLKLGASLVIGARNVIKAENVKMEFLEEHRGAEIQIFELDMESFDSIDRFIKQLTFEKIYLDVALLNAGFFSRDTKMTADGYVDIFQVNFLGTAYLSLLLLPFMRSTNSPARLVLVSSEAHAWTHFKKSKSNTILSTFQQAIPGQEADQYYLSKLFLALFGRELGSFVNEKQVVVTTTTPGFCASGFFPSDGLLTKLIKMTSARSSEQGASLHIYAVTAAASAVHGKYLRDGCETRNSSLSKFAETKEGLELQHQLWVEV